MPLYDYKCTNKKCGKCFEIFVKLHKLGTEIKCPVCKKPLKKILSPVMFKI